MPFHSLVKIPPDWMTVKWVNLIYGSFRTWLQDIFNTASLHSLLISCAMKSLK